MKICKVYCGEQVVFTPDALAAGIVAHFRPAGRVCEPCKGGGAFLLYRAGFNPIRRVPITCRICGGGSSMNEAISESLAPAGVSRATRQGTTVVQTHPASSIANAGAVPRRGNEGVTTCK